MSNLLILPRRPRVPPCTPFASAADTSNVVSIFSRRRNRSAFGKETVVRWTEGADGGNAMFSENWAALIGSFGVEQHRLGWHRLIHPDDRFNAVMSRWQSRLGGHPFNFTCRYFVLGAYRLVQFVGAPRRDKRSRIVRWEGFWRLVKRGGER